VTRQRGLALRLKRALDVCGAACGLALGAPALAASASLVRATLGAPVLFRQTRPGRHGRPFELVKLRTMAPPAPGRELEDDALRLGRVGRLLRATSLDELPTLWNVLRGDMSLVGPRPLLTEYLARYTPEQARRHDVLPGVTGWAQVHGRNALDWEEKLALDVWYVDHWSNALDLKILAQTAAALLRPRGVAHAGHATMPKFRGPASTAAPRG